MNKRVAAAIIGIAVIIGLAAALVLFVQRPAGINENKPASVNEIKLGAIVFLTGPQAPLGEEVNNALRLGVSNTNAQGGINGSKVDLLVEDSKDSPKDAIAAFNKLLIDDPLAIISTGDVVSLNLAPLANERGIPLIATVAAGPDILKQGKWVFRVWILATAQAETVARYALNDLHLKTAAVLYINNEYGDAAFSQFQTIFTSGGGTVVNHDSYGIADRDIRSQIAKVIATNPQAIFVAGFGDGYGACIRQIRELGYKGYILADNTLSIPYFRQQTKEANEGAYFASTVYDEFSTEPNTVQFVQSYKQAYKSDPSFVAAFAYDAIGILLDALKTGAREPAAIRQALLNIKNYKGVVGNISFYENGELHLPLVVKKIEKGVPILVKSKM